MNVEPTARRSKPSKAASAHVETLMSALDDIQDPVMRAWVCGMVLDPSNSHRIRRMRAEAVVKLRQQGQTWAAIADSLGITRERAVAIAAIGRPSNPSSRRRAAVVPAPVAEEPAATNADW